jgi:hypothetical protein
MGVGGIVAVGAVVGTVVGAGVAAGPQADSTRAEKMNKAKAYIEMCFIVLFS